MTEPSHLPAFSLPGSDGRTWTRSDLVGRTTVLYFYPKDATSGCTTQACDFRAAHDRLLTAGCQVIGVSPDSVASHGRFIAKQSLPFVLLSDPDHALAEALGVWAEKVLYGRRYMGIVRSTFLCGPGGEIRQAWRSVKVAGHVEAVLAAVAAGADAPARKRRT